MSLSTSRYRRSKLTSVQYTVESNEVNSLKVIQANVWAVLWYRRGFQWIFLPMADYYQCNDDNRVTAITWYVTLSVVCSSLYFSMHLMVSVFISTVMLPSNNFNG